jgi:8-oxo-dGTP diphosphatase
MCTPALSVDVIIETPGGDSVLLVERKDGRGFAIVGGFVQVDESAETAAAREVMEETGLELAKLEQFHVFSDPSRDPRRHTASLTFIGRAATAWKGAKAGDDAKSLKTVSVEELKAGGVRLAFDHGTILGKYLQERHLSAIPRS